MVSKMRVSKNELERKVRILNGVLELMGLQLRLRVDRAYGKTFINIINIYDENTTGGILDTLFVGTKTECMKFLNGVHILLSTITKRQQSTSS